MVLFCLCAVAGIAAAIAIDVAIRAILLVMTLTLEACDPHE
jgi:hypothetical protein